MIVCSALYSLELLVSLYPTEDTEERIKSQAFNTIA